MPAGIGQYRLRKIFAEYVSPAERGRHVDDAQTDFHGETEGCLDCNCANRREPLVRIRRLFDIRIAGQRGAPETVRL